MKSRWVEAVRRGVSAGSPRASRTNGPPFASQSTATLSELSSSAEAENPAFAHFPDRCASVGGDCSVARVLDNCVLQGGVHHSHMNMLTYLGRPLRAEYCCYPVTVQWFRAFDDHDDFQIIPGAKDEFFTPTADDIGARILAKVMIEDEDVVKTKMLEYGPIKEDPEVRSKVESYLDRKSVLFMGLQSVAVQNSSEFPEVEELRESWTLLIDDRRVRLTCESSLLPAFESLYTPDIKLEVTNSSPNEFCLFFHEESFVRLRAASNLVRDIIVLTLRAFCNVAVTSEVGHEAVARGLSPMLTLRTLAAQEATQQQHTQPAQAVAPPVPPAYDLPWNRGGGTFGLNAVVDGKPREVHDVEDEFVEQDRSRRPSFSSNFSGGGSSLFGDEWDESLLLDAEALIGNAMKMGIQNQILPRAPKRISIMDIPDLQIVETMEGSAAKPDKNEQSATQRRRRRLSAIGSDGSTPRGSFDGSNSDDSGFDDSALELFEGETKPELDHPERILAPAVDPSCIDEAIKEFMEGDADEDVKKSIDVEALRSRYIAIFVALQHELHDYKKRVHRLAQQLDEKRDETASFRTDIETLQDALRSLQLSTKMYERVTDDLAQVKSTAASPLSPMIASVVNATATAIGPNFY